MQRLEIDRRQFPVRSASEHNTGSFLQLRLPLCDLVGMHIELLRQLGDCRRYRESIMPRRPLPNAKSEVAAEMVRMPGSPLPRFLFVRDPWTLPEARASLIWTIRGRYLTPDEAALERDWNTRPGDFNYAARSASNRLWEFARGRQLRFDEHAAAVHRIDLFSDALGNKKSTRSPDRYSVCFQGRAGWRMPTNPEKRYGNGSARYSHQSRRSYPEQRPDS